MKITEVQAELLDLLPLWYCQITKLFEQCLDHGVSLDLYYCIRAIQWGGGLITMTALADRLQITKQHATKKVDRLVELGFVKRVYEPSDRRMVKVQATELGSKFVADFLEKEAGGLKILIGKMNMEEQKEFLNSVVALNKILFKTMEYGSYHTLKNMKDIT
ncbi:MAG: MarR family transcriptional regulator [Lachnospiraceae bacterium]|nr:MarR family transcriptional regulator [Lachnospiraceae bacterium]